MMGMVYTELLEMIEQRFSFDMVDAVIAKAGARGSYTSVGNYTDEELVAIVVALSEESGIAVPALLHAYGTFLFQRFHDMFPGFFTIHPHAPSFLKGLETHVHTEVRKLYPVATPPLFDWTMAEGDDIYLNYRSKRGLWKFAQGLLEACLAHYGGAHEIGEVIDLSEGAGTHVRFHIRSVAE